MEELALAVKATNPLEEDAEYEDLYFGVLDGLSTTLFVSKFDLVGKFFSAENPLLVFVGKLERTEVRLPPLVPGTNCARIGNFIFLGQHPRAMMFCEAFTSLARINELNFLPEFTGKISSIREQYKKEILSQVAKQLPEYFGSQYIADRYLDDDEEKYYMYSMNGYKNNFKLKPSIVFDITHTVPRNLLRVPFKQQRGFGSDLTFFSNGNYLLADVRDNLYGHFVGIKIAQHCRMITAINAAMDLKNRIIQYDTMNIVPLCHYNAEWLKENRQRICTQIQKEVEHLHETYQVSHAQICMNRIVHRTTTDTFHLLPSCIMKTWSYHLRQYNLFNTDYDDGFQYDQFCIGALGFELEFGITIVDESLLPNPMPPFVAKITENDDDFSKAIAYLLHHRNEKGNDISIFLNMINRDPSQILTSIFDGVEFSSSNREPDPRYAPYLKFIKENQMLKHLYYGTDEEAKDSPGNFWYSSTLPEEVDSSIFHSISNNEFQDYETRFKYLLYKMEKENMKENLRLYRYLVNLIEVLWGMQMPKNFFKNIKDSVFYEGLTDYEANFLRTYPDQVENVEVIPEGQLDRVLFGIFVDKILRTEGIYYTFKDNEKFKIVPFSFTEFGSSTLPNDFDAVSSSTMSTLFSSFFKTQ